MTQDLPSKISHPERISYRLWYMGGGASLRAVISESGLSEPKVQKVLHGLTLRNRNSETARQGHKGRQNPPETSQKFGRTGGPQSPPLAML